MTPLPVYYRSLVSVCMLLARFILRCTCQMHQSCERGPGLSSELSKYSQLLLPSPSCACYQDGVSDLMSFRSDVAFERGSLLHAWTVVGSDVGLTACCCGAFRFVVFLSTLNGTFDTKSVMFSSFVAVCNLLLIDHHDIRCWMI